MPNLKERIRQAIVDVHDGDTPPGSLRDDVEQLRNDTDLRLSQSEQNIEQLFQRVAKLETKANESGN